jgi:hypothetical protein
MKLRRGGRGLSRAVHRPEECTVSGFTRAAIDLLVHSLFPLHVHSMKLTLKHQLRPRPFASMLGFLDLKTGVTLVVLFAVRPPLRPISRLPPCDTNARLSGAKQGRWRLRTHSSAHRCRW